MGQLEAVTRHGAFLSLFARGTYKRESRNESGIARLQFSSVQLVDLGFWEKGQHLDGVRDHPDKQHWIWIRIIE